MKRGGLKEASAHTGLTVWELRTGALSGKYPYMRVGGQQGKFWFDFDLLDSTIEQLMLQNAAPVEPEPRTGIIRPVEMKVIGR